MTIAPLIALLAVTAQQRDQFFDNGPVKLHYLDFGGSGPVMLMLPDFTDSASIFSELGPLLGERNHVFAMTRRGQAKSGVGSEYSVDAFADDIFAFLQFIRADRVVLLGHGMAGDEMVAFARKHPQMVMGMVFLDAAYKRSAGPLGSALRMGFQPAPDKYLKNLGYFVDFQMKSYPTGFTTPYQCIMDKVTAKTEGGPVVEKMTPETGNALMQAQLNAKTDYTNLPWPSLGIFARIGPPRGASSASQALYGDAYAGWISWQDACVKDFRASKNKVVMMDKASHYMFIDQLTPTSREIASFVMRLK